MNFIDHPILYSDNAGSEEWKRLTQEANGHKGFRRRFARRKMRRTIKELLRGVRPRIHLNFAC